MKTWRLRSVAATNLVIVAFMVFVAGVVLIFIAITSRGGARTPITDSPSELEGQDSAINWSNPPDGVLVDSIGAAQADLPFSVHVPKGLGTPRIYVRARDGEQAEDHVIAFVYPGSDGIVVVEEHLPYVSPAEYRRWQMAAVSPPKPGEFRSGTAELAKVRGEDALLTVSADGKSSILFWTEGGVEFILGGSNLRPDDALAMAEAL